MCLGLPGRIVAINGKTARVDFWGSVRPVKLDALKEAIVPGDYIIDHAGYAVRRIPDEDVADTLALYEVILCEAGGDPIAMDAIAALEKSEEELVLA
ncbi:MAG TPA: HypC/HybG/HupF family hydrogenase formation chaperone [Thermoanaerobaculia bacterium]|nr:HypC/HybG/HupF family hydrogenase formation chaperone [Thermoanaerobaculia bacterium]